MENHLQFSPLQSFVSPTFWHKLAEVKLDFDRLSDAPKAIKGFYTNRNAKQCLLEVDYSVFNGDFVPPKFNYTTIGTIYNKNTIEEFKETDKNALMQLEGYKLLEDFANGRVLEEPNCLARFAILSFADLKCHAYYYWFAFPCPLIPTLNIAKEPMHLKNNAILQLQLQEHLANYSNDEQNFFAIHTKDSGRIYKLKEIFEIDELWADVKDLYFCFADASEFENPSWFMRLYAAFLYYKRPSLVGQNLKFVGLRYDNHMKLDNSWIWEICLNEAIDFDNIKFVGWELNRNNKMGPKMVSMKESMDPAKLAENSVHLNLKLMKWRLLPDLNLETIMQTKCLIFGAGTLGCAVARNLLGWGFKHLSFIDNGRVSYANPVRQFLYTYQDAVAGNVMKAQIAAERLRDINPGVISKGHVMQIPMPGHTVGESLQQQTIEDLNKIKQLVEEHDVIFMLTDSRESRWLPTLMGAAHNKIVINAALGFDSYLVMRHGSSGGGDSTENGAGDASCSTQNIGDLKCIKGFNLGCYFCNDVTAPGNSLKDRTLDQQCTVTRPGVSNIAASYAVELLVSLLQHPMREKAPAYFSSSGKSDAKVPEGILGIIPHSIRGMLCNYENILPATQKFNQCIACSEKVLSEYRLRGNEFLLKAFETTKYLEDLTGISDYKELSSEIIDFDDSDLEMSDS